jgi:SAM-dependent methyltransferase
VTAEHPADRPAPVDYDAELRRHQEVLSRACAVQPHEHVLDIGCGAGTTTRQAARAAPAGSALGVDVAGPAIERARRHARDEGLGNVAFEQADAQTHRFPPRHFDLACSRFGTMFFDDPVAAFANVGRALRPGARLVMLVWQAAERNEWHTAVHRALGVPGGSGSAGPDAFSLADPAVVRQTLEAAGFHQITLAGVDEPVHYGPDTATALDWIGRFTCTRAILDGLGPSAAADALGRLGEVLTAHRTGDGVWLGSRSWLVTARR